MVYFTIKAKIAVTMAEYPRTANGTDCLAPQLVEPAAVEQTRNRCGRLGRGDKADEQGADQTADEVHADHVERIVKAQFVFQADRERTQHARAKPTTRSRRPR